MTCAVDTSWSLLTTLLFPAATLGDRQLLVEDEEAEEDSGNDPR